MLLKVIISTALLLLGLWSLCAWIRLDPPASVLLTIPKMLYMSFIAPILVIYLILLLAYSFAFLYLSFNEHPIDSFYFFSYLLLWLYTLVGFIYCDFIRHAPINGNPLNPLHEKIINKEHLHTKCSFTTSDFTSQKSAKQFILYTPSEGKHQETCLFYLNYEGWSVPSNIKSSLYLRDLALKEGYSFCIYGGKAKEETHLPGMVTDIQEALTCLRIKTPLSRFILCGSSAGAHLALVAAFSNTQPQIFAPFPLQADGVIALYPTVDLTEHYIYFTCKDEASKSFLDHMGDALFRLMMKEKPRTLGEASKKIMTQLVGGPYESLAPIYEGASIRNMLTEKDIPVFLVHGSHDSHIPVEPTRELYELMKAQHKTVDYLELPFVEHAFDSLNVNHSVVGHKVKREIINWLYTYFR